MSGGGENLRLLKGFTLAEVLITIGIIGVVAALTLHVLITNYQKNVLKEQFKKTYSVLSQSLNNVVSEYGIVPECYYNISSSGAITGSRFVECKIARDIILNNINVVKICENQSYANGCIPKYNGFDDIKKENNPDMSDDDIEASMDGIVGFSRNHMLNINPSYVLADGTIIVSYVEIFPLLFAVDINGKKGPNKWGYDLFAFKAAQDVNKAYLAGPTDYPVEKGGMTTREMLEEMNK